MKKKCVIDIYSGEAYDKSRHVARRLYWSDGRLCYWGWLYGSGGEIVGDYTAESVQAAEKALCVKFDHN